MIRQLSIASPLGMSAVIGVLIVLYYVIGEGPATRPMELRSFSFAEFFFEARRQWAFTLTFVLGGIFGALLLTGHIAEPLRVTLAHSSTRTGELSAWQAIALGGGFGALLGATVPTLYEMFYVGESRAGRWGRPIDVIRSTSYSSATIGLWSAVICFPALWIVFGLLAAISAIPLFMILVYIDVFLFTLIGNCGILRP